MRILYGILITYSLLSSSDAFAEISSDSCLTDFYQIYGFNTDDIFQYRTEDYGDAGGWLELHLTISKYKIVNRDIREDTILYDIEGIEYSHWEDDLNNVWGVESRIINDNIIYVDSATHMLNHCNDTVFYGPHFGYSLYVLVTDTIIEEIPGKYIGGLNRVYIKDDNNHYEPLNEAELRFKEIYLNNLGLINSETNEFEHGIRKWLEGYIKNGDTTGIITSDENLIVGLYEKEVFNKHSFYPNPANSIIHFRFPGKSVNLHINIYNASGILVKSVKLNNEQINIEDLTNGLYLYKISDISDVFVYKGIFIKK